MVIKSSKGNYVVMKLLGEGGFGAVYKVFDQKNPLNEYAMKVEKKLKSRRHSKLKMEIAILKVVSQERKQSHFTVIINRGKKAKFYFLVMELVGSSLASLKMSLPTRMFSLSTAMGASIQCLEACQDLHKYGFIHRDLKPANYACGLGNRRRIVYILDFGIARKILNSKGELKPPREFVRFKGTIRFASIACHRNAEMSPKDDCESWFYMLLDFLAPRGSTSNLREKGTSFLYLESDSYNYLGSTETASHFQELAFNGVKCKAELIEIMSYLDKLQYHDHVDYGHIYTILTTVSKL
uniref:Protein kinase domain-containing protein n=1 Tax=Angiostrongylus cantonensis TaxID=6313 RepID=A0A0K0CXL9_ANGCA